MKYFDSFEICKIDFAEANQLKQFETKMQQ